MLGITKLYSGVNSHQIYTTVTSWWYAINKQRYTHKAKRACANPEVIWGREIQLHICSRWKWVVTCTVWLLYSWEKIPQHPLNRRLSRPQSWPACFGEEKDCLGPAGNQAMIFQFYRPVSILTTLSWIILNLAMISVSKLLNCFN